VIGGEREYDRLWIAFRGERGRRCDGGPRVAPYRLDDDGRRDPYFFGLPLSEKMEVWSGNDDRRREY
jgi:hypothetical protein